MNQSRRFLSSAHLIWLYIFLIPTAILTVSSLFKSEEFELYRDIEHIIYENDHPLILLILLLLFVLIIRFLLRKKAECAPQVLSKSKNYDLYFLMSAAGICSLFFLLELRSKPYMDCVELIAVAEQFSRNDFSALSTPDHNSYLYIYAFQIGMVSILEVIFRLFGEGNYFIYQLLNIIGVIAIVRNIHEISILIFDDKNVVRLTDLLLCFCFPLYINVTFVYGDILGWAFAIGALLSTLRWVCDRKVSHLIVTAISISVGILIKSNDYIFLIAILIIIFLESARKREWTTLLYGVLCVVIAFLLPFTVKAVYASRAGIDQYPTGAPASCWIAMSLIEDRNFEKGWYNGYNISTFVESGYDPELADQIASARIAERLSTFVHHPKYALGFFMTKFVSAWNDPQFNSQIKIEWSTRHVEGLSPLALSIIEGRGRRLLFLAANILHYFVFSGTLAALVILLKKKDQTTRLAAYLILSVLGGMLFHLMWETQARYMIPYYVLLFPAAAYGLMKMAAMQK